MVCGKTPKELPLGWKEHVKVANGRKIKCYTNTVTGEKFYSKIGVIRYVNSNDVSQGTSPSVSKSEVQRSHSESKASQIAVNTNESSEWLPQGWIVENRTRKSGNTASVYKVYIDPSSRFKFYSKPQVIRYLQSVDVNNGAVKQRKLRSSVELDTSQHSEPVEIKRHIMGERKNDMGKPSLKDVEERNGGLDELPPGWIKEIRTKKSGHRIRKDPYYIDPEYGYAFRSKKDALRYLETGDISSCAIKPKKWNLSEPKTVKDAIHSASLSGGKKLGLSARGRQLFFGDNSEYGNGSSHTRTIAVAEAQCSKEKEGDRVPIDPNIAISSVAAEEMYSCSKSVECGISGESSEPKTEGLNQNVKIVNVGSVSSIVIADLHEHELQKSQMDSETQIDMRKSRKGKSRSMPTRSSKRLAGSEPEMLPNLDLSERALRAAIKKSHRTEANRSARSGLNAAINEVPLHLDAKTEIEVADHISICAEASIEIDPENNSTMPSVNQVVQRQTGGQAIETQDEQNPGLQGDYWSDPCFEFAFKTLTGAIPIEDTVTLQGCFQQHIDTAYTQGHASFGQPVADVPPFFHYDVPYNLDTLQNNVSKDQLLTNPTFLPPENIGLPGFSGVGSQQPSLDARSKDYPAKVKKC